MQLLLKYKMTIDMDSITYMNVLVNSQHSKMIVKLNHSYLLDHALTL